MPAQIIGGAAAAIYINQALYGVAPSNAIYNSDLAFVNANGASAYAIAKGASFAATTDAALTTLVLTNMGITATTIPAASYTALADAVTVLFGAYPTMRGQIILNMGNLLANIDPADAVYGNAATRWNGSANQSLTYSANAANGTNLLVDVSTVALVSGQTYTLTANVDAIAGGAGNDTINGSDTTFTGLDVINGGAGTDVLNLSDVAGGMSLSKASSVTNVETLNVTSTAGVTAADLSAWTGLTSATFALKGAAAGLTLADTTAVTMTNTSNSSQTINGGSVINYTTSGTGNFVVNGADGTTKVTVSGGSAITVNDSSASADTITTVSLDGNTSTGTLTGDAITTVSLANLNNVYTNIVNSTAKHTLDVTVNNLTNNATIADAAATTVNIVTTGKASNISATFTAATALNVSGDVGLTVAYWGTAALKTITVSGKAGLTASTLAGDTSTVTLVDASASSGANTVTLDATTSFKGGSGVDKATVTATATVAVDGGAGTADVLTLNGVAASTQVGTKATGFEVLALGAAANGSYAATGFTALQQGAVAAAVDYSAVGAAATLTMTAAPGFSTGVALADATGTADTFSLKLTNTAGFTAGTVTVAGVESVSINSDDSAATATGIQHTLTLVATSAPVITVTGDAGLAFTNANTSLTTVDASAVTKGSFTFTSGALTKAATISGGAGADTIVATAATKAVILNGNAGNDTLTVANALNNTVNGGDGNDTIVVGTGSNTITAGAGNDSVTVGAAAGLNTIDVGAGTDTVVIGGIQTAGGYYTSITGMGVGDSLNLAAVTTTARADGALGAKIVLGGSATFANYLDAATATNLSATGALTPSLMKWFQLNGNTYIVVDNATTVGADTVDTTTFQDGLDTVVELVGLIDLSTSTTATDVLLIVAP